MQSALIIGYDPGGNGSHGLAELHVKNGKATSLLTWTFGTAENIISYIDGLTSLTALGVDTLTCWSTGPGGWRPADRWLRQNYPEMLHSVVSSNSLYGSMGLNGMAVLIAARHRFPNLHVTETHPKVLYWQISKQRYNYSTNRTAMNEVLSSRLGISVAPQTEHEWDAAISAFVAFESNESRWTNDLHSLETEANERLIEPCGTTQYSWPE